MMAGITDFIALDVETANADFASICCEDPAIAFKSQAPPPTTYPLASTSIFQSICLSEQIERATATNRSKFTFLPRLFPVFIDDQPLGCCNGVRKLSIGGRCRRYVIEIFRYLAQRANYFLVNFHVTDGQEFSAP